MKFHVPDMSCGHCTAAITSGLKAQDASASVTTNLDDRTVEVQSTMTEDQIKSALDAAGYDATLMH